MSTLLRVATLVVIAIIGFQFLENLRVEGAPWWLNLAASLGLGLVLSHFLHRTGLRRRRRSGGLPGLRDEPAGDVRDSDSEPITPRLFERRHGPD